MRTILLALLLLASPVMGAYTDLLYVTKASGASDANPGTIGSPKLTIAGAITAVFALGDKTATVYVEKGYSYNTTSDDIDTTSRAGVKIRFRTYGTGTAPHITPSTDVPIQMTTAGTSIDVDGFTITGDCTSAVINQTAACTDGVVILSNCTITGIKGFTVGANGGFLTFADISSSPENTARSLTMTNCTCEMRSNQAAAQAGSWFSMYDFVNCTITGCTFNDHVSNYGDVLNFRDYVKGDITITNNVFNVRSGPMSEQAFGASAVVSNTYRTRMTVTGNSGLIGRYFVNMGKNYQSLIVDDNDFQTANFVVGGTPANVEINDVFGVTIGGTSVTFTATAATVANVCQGLTTALNAAGSPFDAITWYNKSDASITGVADSRTISSGFTCTLTATDGGGTNNQTFARALTNDKPIIYVGLENTVSESNPPAFGGVTITRNRIRQYGPVMGHGIFSGCNSRGAFIGYNIVEDADWAIVAKADGINVVHNTVKLSSSSAVTGTSSGICVAAGQNNLVSNNTVYAAVGVPCVFITDVSGTYSQGTQVVDNVFVTNAASSGGILVKANGADHKNHFDRNYYNISGTSSYVLQADVDSSGAVETYATLALAKAAYASYSEWGLKDYFSTDTSARLNTATMRLNMQSPARRDADYMNTSLGAWQRGEMVGRQPFWNLAAPYER